MHIAIDVSSLQNDHKYRGIGQYTKYLVEALKKSKSKHSYSFFTRVQNVPKNADLVHYPYFDPFTISLPLIKSKPMIVTVHDLIPIVYAHHFPRGIRGTLKWFIQKQSLLKAKRIITDSKASKKDIIEQTGFIENNIDVVYLAPSKAPPNKEKTNLRLPKHYILYIGDINWNKNIPGLLRAFSLVRQRYKTELVLVGKAFLDNNTPETIKINELLGELNIKAYVHTLGFVNETDLQIIFSKAALYIQPSYAEGFGLSVLDAMAYGCPVVSAHTTSLIEIGGPSQFVNPDNSQSIAKGLLTVLKMHTHQREMLIRDGYLWAKKFSWDRVAHETIGAYEKALD